MCDKEMFSCCSEMQFSRSELQTESQLNYTVKPNTQN